MVSRAVPDDSPIGLPVCQLLQCRLVYRDWKRMDGTMLKQSFNVVKTRLAFDLYVRHFCGVQGRHIPRGPRLGTSSGGASGVQVPG